VYKLVASITINIFLNLWHGSCFVYILISGSQSCSSLYPSQGSDYVLITLNISQWSLIT